MGWLWFCSMSSFLQEPRWQGSLYLDCTFPFIQHSPSHACCPREMINSLSFHFQECTLLLSNIPVLDNKLHAIFIIYVMDDILAKEKKRSGKNTHWFLNVSARKWLKSLLPTFHWLKQVTCLLLSSAQWERIIDPEEGSKYFEQNTSCHSEERKT